MPPDLWLLALCIRMVLLFSAVEDRALKLNNYPFWLVQVGKKSDVRGVRL